MNQREQEEPSLSEERTRNQRRNEEQEGDTRARSTATPPLSDDPALLKRKEIRPGPFPGQERIRFVRPSRTPFQRVDTGLLKATEATLEPSSVFGKLTYRTKRFLIGTPLANERAIHERLTKFKALAVLSSDAISSVAYATEECLFVLLFIGFAAPTMALSYLIPISLVIIALLAIVALSYSQTIPAYPNGGGSYIVAKDNLGNLPGLIAAAALLIDYVLTVSVSVTSGVQNLLVLILPPETPATTVTAYLVGLDILVVAIITIVNLRGVRESGSIFAIPTYFFVCSAYLMILVGLFRGFTDPHLHHAVATTQHATTSLGLFLILRAFASGCSAMTGTEAISNGVPAFKKPEARNARITLIWMAAILGSLFAGITFLTVWFGLLPNPGSNPTLISLVSQTAFTGTALSFMYPVFQVAILLILVLAANTSYADFPRLASLLARDHYLPHQFAFRGDRLSFSVGIIFLAFLAGLLLVVFQGSISNLIDLYAVGVFISFTLSQSGMVVHWWRLRGAHWMRSMVINGGGAGATFTVAVVIASTKFTSGAWVVVVLIPLLVLMFLGIHRHYVRVERKRTSNIPPRPAEIRHLFIVPIADLDMVSVQSLSYARSISKRVIAAHVAIDEEDAHLVRKKWEKWMSQLGAEEKERLELVIIESPYRSLNAPLLAYIDTVHELYRDMTLTVLLPEFVVAHWWERLLHNQTALRLKAALLFRPGLVVTNMPQHLFDESNNNEERA